MRPILRTLNERGLTLWKSYQHFAVSGIAPDSPNPQAADARQSKTARSACHTDAAGAIAHRIARASRDQKNRQKEKTT